MAEKKYFLIFPNHSDQWGGIMPEQNYIHPNESYANNYYETNINGNRSQQQYPLSL